VGILHCVRTLCLYGYIVFVYVYCICVGILCLCRYIVFVSVYCINVGILYCMGILHL
jgi:hypothetical protein